MLTDSNIKVTYTDTPDMYTGQVISQTWQSAPYVGERVLLVKEAVHDFRQALATWVGGVKDFVTKLNIKSVTMEGYVKIY